MVRIVVAPQEFKGSLTAAGAARAIAAGVRAALPDADVVEVAMSDGGPGLVDALLSSLGGERVETEVHDPLMRPVRAAWALLGDGTAAIEMAAASGLLLLGERERDPLGATTYGTGELIRAALDRGCERVILGAGGSATVDGGAGAMQALGARLRDGAGGELPPGGGTLARLVRIDLQDVDQRLKRGRVRVASDVTNRLCGSEGAAVMFGPQKGATPEDVQTLDAALRRFGVIAARDCGVDVLSLAGGGAAGGLGAGLAALAPSSVTIDHGFPLVAEAVRLEEKIASCDAAITGEGRLDAQTAFGKTAAGVAAMASRHGARIGVVAGSVDGDFDRDRSPFDAVESVMQPGMSAGQAIASGADGVRDAAARLVRRMIDGGVIAG